MAVLTFGKQSFSAPINWEAARNTAAPSDVLVEGRLIEAINAGVTRGETTVHGVSFSGSDSLLPNSAGVDFLSGRTTLDESFDQLLGTLDYGGGTSTTISIGGGQLVPGQSYRVQVFFTDLRSCCSNRTMTFGDGSGNTVSLNSSGGPGAFGQHSVGLFTADATSQELRLSIASGNVHLTAYQIRTATPPPVIRSFRADPALVSSGQPTTLRWEVVNARTVLLEGVGGVPPDGSLEVTPIATRSYTLTAANAGGETIAETAVGVDVAVLAPILNEFLASNDDMILDEDGDPSDWIEIHNPNVFEFDLGGYYLTDNREDLEAWQFPSPTLIPGRGYLVLFASGKDRPFAGSELHTSFALDDDGEYLALTAPDGVSILGEFPYPGQRKNISYGRGSQEDSGYFSPPTPGQPNAASFAGFVADTAFSHDRGFYEEPFRVEITSPTPGATIIYTTDGSEPTLNNGHRHPPLDATTPGYAMVGIRRTTVLRAAAFKEGLAATNVDTQSYLFPSDIIRQPEMDPEVVDDPSYRHEMIPALKAIPTLSIVTDRGHLFDPSSGILTNTGGRGRAWERPVSVEFINANGGPEYQNGAGLRIHGNGSRGNPKNSLRLLFRAAYGEKKLNYPLFGEDWITGKFNTVVLRAQNANSWTSTREEDRRSTTFTQDAFAKDLQGAMGHPTAGATFVHLYLNGVYWGLYNPVERPDGSFGEDHFGGDDRDYDALNRRFSVEVLSGSKTFWDEMIAHSATLMDTPDEYERIRGFIDIDNLIDYMLLHQFMQSRDGPDDFGHNNMRLVRRNSPPGPFRLYAWDMEYSMIDRFGIRNYDYPYPIYSSTRSSNRDITDSIASVYLRLKEHNPEFRLRYADRAHRHLRNGGALDVESASALWLKRADEIESAVICESARWGDQRRAIPYTRNIEWRAERTRILTEFFPSRPDHVIAQLRLHGLYPDVDPPSLNQHGGMVPEGFPLAMRTTAGSIYYTLDGSDPREAWSGAIQGDRYTGAIELSRSGIVKVRTLDQGTWSALAEARFFVGPLADATNLVVSEIFYHPEGTVDHEFIELTNISSRAIDLTGASFDGGITFTFPAGSTVQAGGRVLVVQNREAFEERYGAALPVAGEFQHETALANNGELVRLRAADGSPIREFRYDDDIPWPTAPDGSGFSLVLINPAANPDHRSPVNWRSSAFVGGSPGSDDATTFTGTVGADVNRNGIDDLLDYAFGLTGNSPSTMPVRISDLSPVTIAYTHDLRADDVQLTLEWSPNLQDWLPASEAFALINRRTVPGGLQSVEFSPLPEVAAAAERSFFRLVAELVPRP